MNRQIKFRAWLPQYKQMITELFGLRSDGETSFNTEAILMQFTGLKDENGVEIYEGDILTHKCFVGDVVKNEIVFERGAFKMNPIYEIAILAPQNWHVCEIIGNIHQNPELLK